MDDNNVPAGMITVAEAARRMSRSTEQVRRYLREGKLPGHRIGGQWFIDEAELKPLEESKEHHVREAAVMVRATADDKAAYRARIEAVIQSVRENREAIRKRLGGDIEFDVVKMLREDRESH